MGERGFGAAAEGSKVDCGPLCESHTIPACPDHFTPECDPEAMRPTIARTLPLLTLVATLACGADAPTQEGLQQAEVTAALDSLVAELVAERPADAAAYAGACRPTWKATPRSTAVPPR